MMLPNLWSRWGVATLTLLLVFGLHRVGALYPIEVSLRFVLKPLLSQGYDLRQSLVATVQSFGDADANDVLALQQEILKLKGEQLLCEQVRSENDALRRELQVEPRLPNNPSKILGRIIGENPESFSRFLLIDVGTRAGVEKGLPVIAGGALVGYIEETSENLSQMILITDPKSQLSAYIQHTSAQGLVSGTLGLGTVTLTQVGRDTELHPGDTVLTSNPEHSEFRDLLIGTIESISTEDRATYQSAIVKPAVDFKHLQEVFIVKPGT